MELVYMDGRKEPYTTSEIVAEITQVQPLSVVKLIDNNAERFLNLGSLTKMKQSRRVGRPRKVYRLNEAQTYLVISLQRNLTRNTEVVGNYKEVFSKAYQEIKDMVFRPLKNAPQGA